MDEVKPFYRLLTDEEIELARKQKRVADELARRAVKAVGVKMHPRVAEILARRHGAEARGE